MQGSASQPVSIRVGQVSPGKTNRAFYKPSAPHHTARPYYTAYPDDRSGNKLPEDQDVSQRPDNLPRAPSQPSADPVAYSRSLGVAPAPPSVASKALEYALQSRDAPAALGMATSSSMSSYNTTLSIARPGIQGTPPTDVTSSDSPSSIRKPSSTAQVCITFTPSK